MEQRMRKIDGLGGSACLLLTLISCTVSIFTKDYYMHALFVGWLCIILVYFGFYKQSLFYVVIYTFTTFWLLEMIPKGIVFISPMLLGMVYKFIVPIMAAYLTFKIPSGKLIAVFQKCALPQNIILILLVIIRFIPTISGEFKTIREAMKVRGFTGSVKRVLFHPLQTMEYAVVPLIFRSIKVGDELAAASIVRGIENPTKKNSYYETKFTKVDLIIIFISICLMVACILR
ncbi:TPA: energy-coupling factor transporter transmembrane protein EcfT [Streptococcus pyogenes]|nr:energy-coupling factor transporter transmembrane protein EcfT [Streptococcus pyogenes]